MDQKARQLESLYAQQASSWVEIMRHPSRGEDRRFVAWLKESPRNVRDFLLMLSVDHALEKIDAARLQDIDALLARVDARVVPLSVRTAAPAGVRRFSWAAAAAGILVATVAGSAWFLHGRAMWQEFETATGEQRTLELEDGSVVSLNTHSRVAIRLGARTREVRLLSGEALFRVHHEADRPFRVSTDDAVVQAVGTQFDVYRRDDDTMIAVLEGKVNITPATPALQQALLGGAKPSRVSGGAAAAPIVSRSLGASQEARVTHEGTLSIREVSNVTDTVAWRERRLIFRDQTLEHIVGEFNRYRKNPIRLEGSGVMQRVYTGVFDADDADSLLQVLARDPALSVNESGDGIVIRLR